MPKRLKQILSDPFALLLLVFLLQIMVHVFVSHRPYTLAPSGQTYTILGKNFFYPNMILQAKDGAWSIFDSHTTRDVGSVIGHVFFITLGKIAAITGIHQVFMYQLSQIIGGFVLFVTSYWVIKTMLPNKYHWWAVFFVLFVETGPHLWQLGSTGISSLVPGFESQATIPRHFGLPHHIWGEIFGLLWLGVLWKLTQKITPLRIAGIIILSIYATSTLPPYMLTVLLTIIPVWMLFGITRADRIRILTALIVASAFVVLAGLFLKYQFADVLPWNVLTAEEKRWWANAEIIRQYISSFLLYYPFILSLYLLLPIRWRKISSKTRSIILLMSAWLIGPLLYIPLSSYDFFPVANGRLVDGYGYAAAGILAAIGIVETLALISHRKARMIAAVIIGIIMSITSLTLTHTYTRSVLASQENLWTNVYPAQTTWDAVLYADNLPKGSGVMVREYFGEIIPAFANVKVFIGGPHGFPDWPERHWLVGRFFSGEMTIDEAKTLCLENNIDYVFYGPDEKALTTTSAFYTPEFLEPVYTTQTVTIYKVQLE